MPPKKDLPVLLKPRSSDSFAGEDTPSTRIPRGFPVFTSIGLQRRWMLEHMTAALRSFARKGFTEGTSGLISLRDPERSDCFWTNPPGVHFGLIKVSDLAALDYDGQLVAGNQSRPANSARFAVHSPLHKQFPHANAICQVYSPNGKAWSVFARPLDMIIPESAVFRGKSLSICDKYTDTMSRKELHSYLPQKFGESKAMIMQNQGLLTIGRTVDEAAYLFTLLEMCCEIQLKVDSAAASMRVGKPLLNAKSLGHLDSIIDDPEAMYMEFQPDFEFEEATNSSFKE